MDRDRAIDTGSLLNKAYEMQCLREREMNMMDMMTKMDLHQDTAMSSEDRLFMSATCPPAPTPTAALTVVGGRIVNSGGGSTSSGGQAYPVNGQQLQMQLDSLASAMTDMIVNDDEMEMPANQEYNKYIQSRTDEYTSTPFSQDDKRKDPVYLSSLASHTASTTPSSPSTTSNPIDNTTQLDNNQQQQLQQQFFQAFLSQQQITEHQFMQQPQYYQTLLQQQFANYQQQQAELQLQTLVIPSGCCLPSEGKPRLIKRPDLIPIQKCTMWT